MGIIAVFPPPALVAASPMGMDKNGNQTLPLSTWTKLLSWQNRPGFPATSIVGNSLVMNGSGTGTVHFRAGFAWDIGTQQIQAYRNGVAIGTPIESTGGGNTNFAIGSVPGVTIANTHTLDLYGFANSNGFSSNVIQGGGANTYLYFEPS